MTLASHLLQSTLFAAVAGVAALALRKNRARTRHSLWLAASVKFLVPFSLLVALGSHVERQAAPAAPPQLSIVMEDAALPAVPLIVAPAPAPPRWNYHPLLWIWMGGTLAVVIRWSLRWRRASAVLRHARLVGHVSGIPMLSSPAAIEPGVFGIFRPRIMLPQSITSRLSDAQLQTVLAHELCHVRHRDNLAAAIHMLTEAIFWFHPLVWWIGARLVEERERACDEEVLQHGSDPEIYADSILTVCRLCLEPSVPCVSGITGADLHARIESIMTPRVVRRLGAGRTLLLAGLGSAAICGPLAIGLLHATQERSVAPLAFEVASVKLVPERKDFPLPVGFATTPKRSGGRITWVTNARFLVYYAYRVQRWQVEFPAAFSNSFYAVDAKTDEAATEEQIRLMFQTLLKDRFKLAARRQTKEVNGYALVPARGGPKIRAFQDAEEPPPMPDYLGSKASGAFEHRVIISKEGDLAALTGRRGSMEQLATALEEQVQTFVLDKTGMPGNYYYGTKFIPVNSQRDIDGPTLFVALQESLGLRLEKQKGPVEMLVVDHMETAPTEN